MAICEMSRNVEELRVPEKVATNLGHGRLKYRCLLSGYCSQMSARVQYTKRPLQHAAPGLHTGSKGVRSSRVKPTRREGLEHDLALIDRRCRSRHHHRTAVGRPRYQQIAATHLDNERSRSSPFRVIAATTAAHTHLFRTPAFPRRRARKRASVCGHGRSLACSPR